MIQSFVDGVDSVAVEASSGRAQLSLAQAPAGSDQSCALIVGGPSVLSLKPGYLIALSLTREELLWLRDRCQEILGDG